MQVRRCSRAFVSWQAVSAAASFVIRPSRDRQLLVRDRRSERRRNGPGTKREIMD